MNWWSRWLPLRILIFILLKCGRTRAMLASEETSLPRLVVAASHTALSGDLGVLIIELPMAYRSTSPGTPMLASNSSSNPTLEDTDTIELAEGADAEDYGQIPLQEPLVLRVLRLEGFTSESVGEVPVEVPNVSGVNVSLVVPCGLFSRGGSYSLELQRRSASSAQVRASLDVRWPQPSLALEPQHLDTYPNQPVLASLEYTGISCAPALGVPVPSFSLQLVYCGSSVLSCDPRNRSHVQTLYTEEVRGFPSQRLVTLRCEFFGLAGHYALRLKPGAANPSAPTTSAYIKVEWSDLFVFNVHARSIYPCDGGPAGSAGNAGGVSVLFEYPACRLPGDRVRVYGRLRADVASLAPPSSLHYVAELKAPPGKHSLTFDCDLFTERYVEYCFVYISQAYNGAMSEVRVDCIPTFPLQEGDAGGWGAWSQWTPCSSSCVGGTRNRHRFCDTPPPRYGAKFCQGATVESEACGGSAQLDLRGSYSPGDWECRHGEGLAADRPEVTAEVGANCRCGCSLQLEDEAKILAASSKLCPGRSFWLVQSRQDHRLKLYFDQAKFPCSRDELAYVRVRDGDSLIDELLADISAERREPTSGQLVTSGPRLLLEFFSDQQQQHECIAGFLAHVSVSQPGDNLPADLNGTSLTPMILQRPKVVAAAGRWALWLTPAHLVAASLLCLMFLVSVFLALQYAFKYRKYQLAEDLDSLTDNSACSGSMQGIARRARAMSSSTLISEVVSLVRLPVRRASSPRHARLDETSTADVEEGYDSTGSQTEPNEGVAEELESGSQRTIVPAVSISVRSTPTRRSSASSASTTTLAAVSCPNGPATAVGQAEVKYARPVKLRTFGPISPVSEEAVSTSEDGRRFSATSASTSLNNSFSPASSSSNSTLRRYSSGKESKERRNRERLLQGPGSEFSLANQELDLELDYYDYNVVNAGAAPGSYLGMDPAFLVWIPPFSDNEAEQDEDNGGGGDDDDDDAANSRREEPRQYEEIELGEGAALTPGEYRRRLRQHSRIAHLHQEDSSDAGEESTAMQQTQQTTWRKLGECRLHDEIIMEYKARLGEGMLPIHRILEESRLRVSEESLSSTSDIIPNRLEHHPRQDSGSSSSGSSSSSRKLPNKRTKRASSRANQAGKDSSESDTAGPTPRVNDLDTPRTRRRLPELDERDDYCEVNSVSTIALRTPNLPRRHCDILELNALQLEDKSAVNIPLAEFSRNQWQSPAKVHKSKALALQSPDYGVDLRHEIKPSFYDLIAEGDDGIKFADADDDEYIDNKVVA